MDKGVIIDVETTGLDPKSDEVIEIGMLQFAVDRNKELFITNMYGGLAQASKPLSDEIIQLTGLTDEVLGGQQIDWSLVRNWLDQSSVVIAHNAPFDRHFIMRQSAMTGCRAHWACSQRHIDWNAKGFQSQRLNYLAADHGFVNPFAHRAVFDCATTFRLIAPHLDELMQRSYEDMLRIYAVGSAFETKDLLRTRKYRWNPDKRCWYKDVFVSQRDDEVRFLAEMVYGGESRHREEVISLWENQD